MFCKDGRSSPNKPKGKAPFEMILTPDKIWALATANPLSKSIVCLGYTRNNCVVSINNEKVTPSSSENKGRLDCLEVLSREADPTNNPAPASTQFKERGQASFVEAVRNLSPEEKEVYINFLKKEGRFRLDIFINVPPQHGRIYALSIF